MLKRNHKSYESHRSKGNRGWESLVNGKFGLICPCLWAKSRLGAQAASEDVRWEAQESARAILVSEEHRSQQHSHPAVHSARGFITPSKAPKPPLPGLIAWTSSVHINVLRGRRKGQSFLTWQAVTASSRDVADQFKCLRGMFILCSINTPVWEVARCAEMP